MRFSNKVRELFPSSGSSNRKLPDTEKIKIVIWNENHKDQRKFTYDYLAHLLYNVHYTLYITCILYIECTILITRGSLAENLKMHYCCELLGRIHNDIHNPTHQASSHLIFVSHRRLYVPSRNVVQLQQHIY